MEPHSCLIKDIHSETHDVKTFTIEGPKEFVFHAGQHCLLSLPQHDHIKHLQRSMSVASSPSEKGILRFTVKQAGIFTQELFKLKKGDSLTIKGPFGKAILLEGKLAFVAGGSGITPFMSAIRQTIREKLPVQIILFNSNKTQEDIIFRKEIENINKTSHTIKIINTLTRDDWEGEKGRVSQDLILKYIKNPDEYSWHICGPTNMEREVKETLKSLGVSEKKKQEGYHG